MEDFKGKTERQLHDYFVSQVNKIDILKQHAKFCEDNIYGFNDRSLYWVLYLIIKELPEAFRYLEVGVYRGQTLSLVGMMSQGKAFRYGITRNDDFEIKAIHEEFEIRKDYILYDNDEQAFGLTVDFLFLDTLERDFKADYELFPRLVRDGGYMIVSDSYTNSGLFTRYPVIEVPENKSWEFLFMVDNNRVYRRIQNAISGG